MIESVYGMTNLYGCSIMTNFFTYISPPTPCVYLPEQESSLRYDVVPGITATEYAMRMIAGWRRFGISLFRPQCRSCTRCRSLRVDVARFRPSQSQKRAAKLNETEVSLTIGTPSATAEKLELYDRYHAYQSDTIGWPEHAPHTAEEYEQTFVDNPFPTQEWCYRQGDRLLGVGYVDESLFGLSAIYFYYDPEKRDRSLGTWNVLSIIRKAAEKQLPHVYLGYFVDGCRSLQYKERFRPNETLDADGTWKPFIE